MLLYSLRVIYDDIGDICKVSTKLAKTTSHLDEFVSEQMNDSVQKKMMKQVCFIEKAYNYINDKLSEQL